MLKRKRSIAMTQRTSDSGFSLIEVLIAGVLLSVGMLGAVSLVLGILDANKVSKDVTIAVILAQDKMEAIRSSGYDGLPSVDSTVEEGYGSIEDFNGDTAEYADFKRATKTDCDAPEAGMKTVTVSVYRSTGGSTIAFSTILSD